MRYDTIIRNGRWFDGTGAPSAVRTIWAESLQADERSRDDHVLDNHTHYDVEVP